MRLRYLSLAFSVLTLTSFAVGTGADRPTLRGYFATGDIPSQEVEFAGAGFNSGYIQEGGKNDGAHKRPGPTRFSHIVMKRGVTKSKAFFKWVFDAANRDVKRMGGKISLCKVDGTETKRYNFFEAWPCRFEMPELDVASKAPVEVEFTLESSQPVKEERVDSAEKLDGNPNDYSRLAWMEMTVDGMQVEVIRVEPFSMSIAEPPVMFFADSDDSSRIRLSSFDFTVTEPSVPFFLGLMQPSPPGTPIRKSNVVLSFACTSDPFKIVRLSLGGVSFYGMEGSEDARGVRFGTIRSCPESAKITYQPAG